MLFGLVTRRERWGLSGRGWLAVALLGMAVVGSFVLGVDRFLAVTHRVDSHVLVVEGWIDGYAIQAAAAEFQAGAYQRVFTTGVPLAGSGGYTTDENTAAQAAARRLVAAGVPAGLITIVPSHVISRDRTYNSALALADWLRANGVTVRAVNVVTENFHARRTRLLFQEALGDETAVGIIAVPNPDYDSHRWWRYSEGVRDVIAEAAAYVYARFLFRPPR
jgi:uncharacterized SAM-binding protein YcdF (DUF218 family)